MIALTVNGKDHRLVSAPDTPLLWALRDDLGLTGTKYGCGVALCGACTVHIDGVAMRSCSIAISAVRGKRVTTVEAIAHDRIGRLVKTAWIDNDVAQCGYCQSGQVMSAVALLKANSRPSDTDIENAMAGHICRCGTYLRIKAAIRQAATAARA